MLLRLKLRCKAEWTKIQRLNGTDEKRMDIAGRHLARKVEMLKRQFNLSPQGPYDPDDPKIKAILDHYKIQLIIYSKHLGDKGIFFIV